MILMELMNRWIEYFNRFYPKYIQLEKEPRYQMKQFFFYCYNFFKRMGGIWDEYNSRFCELFLIDPSNDFYGKRDPTIDSGQIKKWQKGLEWIIIFQIVSEIGFPHNISAEDKLLDNARINIEKIKSNPEGDYNILMICSAITYLSNNFSDLGGWFKQWLETKQDELIGLDLYKNVAYYSALLFIQDTEDIQKNC